MYYNYAMESFSAETLTSGIRSIFWLFLIVYLITGGVLVYHWQRYGGKSKVLFIVETVFIVGSVIFALAAFFAIPK